MALLRSALSAGVLVFAANSATATVLYDSGGFEASAGFSQNSYLTGQTGGTPAKTWAQSPVPSSDIIPTAAVYSYGVSGANAQYVGVIAGSVPASNYGLFAPQTSSYTPAANEGVAITWTMLTSAGAANNPFFGIVAYNGSTPIAQAGIDASTGALIGASSFTSVSSFTASAGTYYNYELLLNFAAQTYSIYTAPAGSSSFTLRAVGDFENTATSFTDADIASFSVSSAVTPGNYTGSAVFDYYKVETVPVPEPAALGLAGLAFGLLVGRRHRSVR